MAVFISNAITDRGRILLGEAQVGATLEATRIVMGSGYIPSGSTAATMTAVVAPVIELAINKKKRAGDGTVTFGGAFSNETITEAFYFREFALFARVQYADGTYSDEALYSYGNAGGNADLIPAYSTSTVVEKQMDLVVWVGNETRVNLTVASGLYDPHAEKHAADGEDPITPEMIGAAPAVEHYVKSYTSLERLGITVGEETIEGIVSALPNNAMLQYEVSPENNLAILPSTAEQYGMMYVNRIDSARVLFAYVHKKAPFEEYTGIYGTDQGWSGWRQAEKVLGVVPEDDFLAWADKQTTGGSFLVAPDRTTTNIPTESASWFIGHLDYNVSGKRITMTELNTLRTWVNVTRENIFTGWFELANIKDVVSKAGDKVNGELQFENFGEYYTLRKGRTIANGKTHFLTMGLSSGGSTTLEHYTCDSEEFDSTKLDGRLELGQVAGDNNWLNTYALVLRSDNANGPTYRIYGEHFSPAVIATAELV